MNDGRGEILAAATTAAVKKRENSTYTHPHPYDKVDGKVLCL